MSITREFLRRPWATGAVAASSRRLAAAMTDGLDLERAATVVELGPGTGAITEAIVSRLGAGARLVAVELNPVLAARLAKRYPVEVVQASAAELADIVPYPVDAIVAGLPWTVMPAAEQRRILDAVAAVLQRGGRFSTFAYAHAGWTPPAKRFTAELAARFSTVERSGMVWANLPPAYVHRAFEPRRSWLRDRAPAS
ncbi:methyltransferase domain-containing protein [Micromonospora sp. CPCC 205371]|nr:methyltransferase domain-containing protein [Micromonospora sp. CPCC 205371]